MVTNTTKPLEGLKVLLFHLYTSEEVRLSSLKWRTTVNGGESVGLQSQKLDLIYCKFWALDVAFCGLHTAMVLSLNVCCKAPIQPVNVLCFGISDVMQQRYQADRCIVHNLIKGQQRKLRDQFKKLNSSYV